RHHVIAETAASSKWGDYLAAGRCVLAFGPPYSAIVRHARENGIGAVVSSAEPGALRESLLALAADPERRRLLAERGYRFGRVRHNRRINHARLWQILLDIARSGSRRAAEQRCVSW